MKYRGENMMKKFYAWIKTKIQDNFKRERAALTEREHEVSLLLSTGKTIKEISRILNIAYRTTECHIHNIKHKLKDSSKD